jgi:hypothetical protein
MPKEKECKILIPEDPGNKGKEQYKIFQRDGRTIQVPIGKYVTVPEWLAVRAKEIGYISDYLEL